LLLLLWLLPEQSPSTRRRSSKQPSPGLRGRLRGRWAKQTGGRPSRSRLVGLGAKEPSPGSGLLLLLLRIGSAEPAESGLGSGTCLASMSKQDSHRCWLHGHDGQPDHLLPKRPPPPPVEVLAAGVAPARASGQRTRVRGGGWCRFRASSPKVNDDMALGVVRSQGTVPMPMQPGAARASGDEPDRLTVARRR
jgi:hypothetical protein